MIRPKASPTPPSLITQSLECAHQGTWPHGRAAAASRPAAAADAAASGTGHRRWCRCRSPYTARQQMQEAIWKRCEERSSSGPEEAYQRKGSEGSSARLRVHSLAPSAGFVQQQEQERGSRWETNFPRTLTLIFIPLHPHSGTHRLTHKSDGEQEIQRSRSESRRRKRERGQEGRREERGKERRERDAGRAERIALAFEGIRRRTRPANASSAPSLLPLPPPTSPSSSCSCSCLLPHPRAHSYPTAAPRDWHCCLPSARARPFPASFHAMPASERVERRGEKKRRRGGRTRKGGKEGATGRSPRRRQQEP